MTLVTPMNLRTALFVLAFAGTLPLAAHGQGHEHGAARLDLALEGRLLSLQLEAPLEALLGFERAPRNDAERRLVDVAVARLKASDRLFMPDAAGACALRRVELTSPVLKLGAGAGGAHGKPAGAGHADLDAIIEFDCKDPTKLSFIEVALFEAFPKMQRIDVQVATDKGQSRRSLKRPANRITLPSQRQ